MSGVSVSLHQDTPIPLDLEFSCGPGQLLALVGPSGSGKSTVLRAIAGTYHPSHGRVTVDGETWLETDRGINLPTWKRRVGMVFQSYALFPHLTAAENVAAALLHLPAGDRMPRACELLELLHLAGLEHRTPSQLSGGQQQRVAVARALAREPKALLLDEPVSAVDKATRSKLYRELASLRSRLNMPIILVTHDLDEALRLADRMCLLQRGAIIQAGPPLEIVQCPVTVEAARLVGHRNLFPARVLDQCPQEQVTVLDWRGCRLEAAYQPHWSPGTDVTWLIAPSKVIVHRPDQQPPGSIENAVSGIIVEHVSLGDTAILSVRLNTNEPRTLDIRLLRHSADQLLLAKGVPISASIIRQAIHIMPAAQPRRRTS